MPQMSGPDLAARLTAARPGLRVLYLSGYPRDALGPHGATEGVVLLEKPFTPAALTLKVRELLDARG
jgi:hypothetical protein